ncbi:MAG: helix-turn-helix domain-containing protein [Pseudomonadota bacterium]
MLEPKMASEDQGLGLAEMYRRRIVTEAVFVTARAHGVTIGEIMSKSRSKSAIVSARQLSMYLSHIVGQMSLGQVAAEFGRERTTVGYSCHAVEDRRDSPLFDEQTERLEKELRARLTSVLNRSVDEEELSRSMRAAF